MKRNSPSSSRTVRVVWDEANLDYLDATKSPKKKITEPKTPYYAPEPEDGTVSPFLDEDEASLDNAAHAEAVRIALNEVAETSHGERRSRGGGGWTSSEDEADEMDHDCEGLEANGNSLSFREHRKAHYDEFRKVKMLRQQGSKITDPDDDDENRLHDTNKSGKDQEVSLAGGVGAIGLWENASSQRSKGESGTQLERQ